MMIKHKIKIVRNAIINALNVRISQIALFLKVKTELCLHARTYFNLKNFRYSFIIVIANII